MSSVNDKVDAFREQMWVNLDDTEHRMTFEFRIDDVLLTIEPRPKYCDRGHWYAKVEGIPGIDEADKFPRYYMDLSAAMDEMKSWLCWRLYKVDIGHL